MENSMRPGMTIFRLTEIAVEKPADNSTKPVRSRDDAG